MGYDEPGIRAASGYIDSDRNGVHSNNPQYNLFESHILELCGATGFALEGLRNAKRIYKKTASGRARDANQ